MIKRFINWLKGTSDEELAERFHRSHNEAYDKICNDDEGEFSIIVEKDVIKMYIKDFEEGKTWVKCKENGDIEKAYIISYIDYVYDKTNSKFVKTEELYEVTFIRIKIPINLKNIFVVNSWEDKWQPYTYINEKYINKIVEASSKDGSHKHTYIEENNG